MKEINTEEVCSILNEIMEYELAGVVRYTHSSMMASGPYRIPIVDFLKEQLAYKTFGKPNLNEKS